MLLHLPVLWQSGKGCLKTKNIAILPFHYVSRDTRTGRNFMKYYYLPIFQIVTSITVITFVNTIALYHFFLNKYHWQNKKKHNPIRFLPHLTLFALGLKTYVNVLKTPLK